MQNKQNIPWVEKYRPTQFENIVLDKKNKNYLIIFWKHNISPICYFTDHLEQEKRPLLLIL